MAWCWIILFLTTTSSGASVSSRKEEELRQFIIHDLHSGATVYEAIGAYNLEKYNEIITIVNKSEYQKLMKIHQSDGSESVYYGL